MITFLRASNVVLFTQTGNLNCYFAHQLYLKYIRKILFHAPEVKGTTHKQDQCNHG